MFLLEQNTTKNGRVDEKIAEQLEFKAKNNNEKYKVEGIRNSIIYAKKSEAGHLLGFYYLVSLKGYPEDKSTWELISTVQYLQKLVSIFHKNYPIN